jgi:hypothetical protein
MLDGHARDVVLRQVLYREVNQRIEGLGENFNLDGRLALLCECGNPKCVARLELSNREYTAVRRFPTRFVVAPGHEIAEVERVVETRPHFLVVEKLGEAGALATRRDWRKPTG